MSRRAAAVSWGSRHIPQTASALALALTLPWLSVPSLWQDEAASISASSRPLGRLPALLSHTDVVHGVYYTLLHCWGEAFGFSTVAIRVPSAIAFAVTVGLIAAIAQRQVGRLGAVVAAGAAFFLPGLSWVALDARPPAFATAAVTAAMYFALRQPARPVLAGVALTVAVAFQVTALLQVVPVVLALGLAQSWRRAGAVGAAVLCVSAPLVLNAHTQQDQIAWIRANTLSDLSSAVLQQPMLGARGSLWGVLTPIGVWVGSALLVVLVAWYLVQRPPLAIVAWAYAGATIAALANLVGIHIYLARYFVTSAPAFPIMIASVICSAPERTGGGRRQGRAIVGLMSALVIASALPWVAQRTTHGHWNDDLRSDARWLEQQRAPAVLYVDRGARSVAIAYPAAAIRAVHVPSFADWQTGDELWGPQLTIAEVRGALRRHHDAVLIGKTGSRHLSDVLLGVTDVCVVTASRREHRLTLTRVRCDRP